MQWQPVVSGIAGFVVAYQMQASNLEWTRNNSYAPTTCNDDDDGISSNVPSKTRYKWNGSIYCVNIVKIKKSEVLFCTSSLYLFFKSSLYFILFCFILFCHTYFYCILKLMLLFFVVVVKDFLIVWKHFFVISTSYQPLLGFVCIHLFCLWFADTCL